MRSLSIFLVAIIALMLCSPFVLAQTAPPSVTGQPSNTITLENPLGQGTTVMSLLKSIFKTMRNILFAIVPIFIIVGAFEMMFAGGNPEKFAKGQKTILYSVIGLVIILMANGIVAIVQSILTV